MSPKSDSEGPVSTMPGLWKYPTNRDIAIRSDVAWLEGRRQDDGAEGLWRIHDTLYDFSRFVQKHPGGAHWLQLTKGTDITEAFEAHHMSPMPAAMINKFKTKDATTRRNSPYTFLPDGFYATLRRRVFEVLPEAHMRGPSVTSRVIVDVLVGASLGAALGAAVLSSPAMAALAGVLLAMSTGATHNFIHMKENWRRFYIHLCLLSVKHFGTIHVLSHHLYPNSLLDLEVSMLEPWLQWLPRADKGWHRYASWLYTPLVYSLVCPLEYLRCVLLHGPDLPDLLPLLVPAAMVAVTAAAHPAQTIGLWAVMMFVCSLWFTATGLNTGHHHPEIFHDGDAPRADRDWGLAQLDSVRDRPSVSGVTSRQEKDEQGRQVVHIDASTCTHLGQYFLALTNFGHHAMHHLFPTVDHYYLPKLYPILEQTLREFGETFETWSVTELVRGQFKQLARSEPNPLPPGAAGGSKIAAKMG